MNLNADTYTSPEVSWEKLYYSFSQVLCNGKSSKKAFPITQSLGKAIMWQYGSKNKAKTWQGRKKTLREKIFCSFSGGLMMKALLNTNS